MIRLLLLLVRAAVFVVHVVQTWNTLAPYGRPVTRYLARLHGALKRGEPLPSPFRGMKTRKSRG